MNRPEQEGDSDRYTQYNWKQITLAEKEYRMANIALIIAGGAGNRMHQDIPKQFITVNERPVIVYTMEAFENHPEIDTISVVFGRTQSSLILRNSSMLFPAGKTGRTPFATA